MLPNNRAIRLSVVVLAAAGFATACVDNDADGTVVEAGVEGGADDATQDTQDDDTDPTETETDVTSDTDDDTASPTDDTDSDDTAETDDTTDECTDEPSVVCDGTTRVEVDPCTDTETVLDTCTNLCELGECVDCAQLSGVICDGEGDNDVYRLDSCGQVGELVETCGAAGCANGTCVEEACEPRVAFECVGTQLTSVDSCGNLGNVEQNCVGCADGACPGCEDAGATLCFDGDIYGLDSCGSLGALLEDCAGTCASSGGDSGGGVACVEDVGACTPTETQVCLLGDLHPQDSCGNVSAEIATACPSGCDETGCLECQPHAIGQQCEGDTVRVILGGCDAAPVLGDVQETCAFGCLEGACVTSPGCEGAECDGGAGDAGLDAGAGDAGDAGVGLDAALDAGADAGDADAAN